MGNKKKSNQKNDPSPNIDSKNEITIEEKEQLQSLLEVSSGLYLARSFEDVGRTIVDVLYSFQLGDILGTKLAIYDATEDTYTIVYQTDKMNQDNFLKVGFPTDVPRTLSEVKHYSKVAIEQRKTLIIQDNHSEYSLSIAPSQKEINEHSMIFIPLIHESILVGLLSFARSPKNSMTPSLVNFLESIAKLITVVICKMLNEKKKLLIEKKVIENQEMYRTLVDISPNAVTLVNLEYKIIFCNQQTADLHGYSTSEELIGVNVLELVSNEEREKFLKESRNTLQSSKATTSEIKLLKKDGSIFLGELTVKILLNSSGKPKAFMGITRDLTQKKQIEAQFLRAQRMESIGTLASGIAHDMNNILSPILMSMEILKEKFSNEQNHRLFETIERSTQRGTDLIRQLLSFAKGDTGEKAEVQISHLINDIVKIIKETFPKNIIIQKNILKPPWIISADPTNLHQVLLNLCLNARDAMPEGGTILITTDNIFIDENYSRNIIDAKIGYYVKVEIQDSGTGIPAEIQDKIFEPFFSTKEKGKGTGLGLSTVYSIVKSHGGFINLYTEIKKGTSFKIYFPAVEQMEIIEKVETKSEILKGDGELILVVDDETIFLDLAKTILENNGYKVLTVKNGAEAVTSYAQNKEEIKAVLLDQIMPIMDGPTTMKVLKTMNPDIKIIAMSGFSTDNIISTPGTVQGFLQKPFHVDKLLMTVYNVLKY